MGYDKCECFECYNNGGGNNLCIDDGSYSETCLTCIDNICGSTSFRVIDALKHFDWNCNGRCTNCDSNGITISILLCEFCHDNREFLDDPNEEYVCDLCDYEGKCNYSNTEELDDFMVCSKCEHELKNIFVKRRRGEPNEWDSWIREYGSCMICNVQNYIQSFSFCNHHIKLAKKG